jgi:hypothetical protein
MGWMRSCNGSSRGQTLVEFAILSPIIILFLVAILDFGMAMNRRIVLQHGAYEAARLAMVTDVSTTDGFAAVCARACDQAQGAIDDDKRVTLDYNDVDTPPYGVNTGDNVKITIPYHWPLPILNSALFGLFKGSIDPINLTATGDSRLELGGSWPAHMVCPPCP